MNRRELRTRFVTVAVAACLLCCGTATAKKPPKPPPDGGGDLVNPAWVIMDGDNVSRMKLLSFDGLADQEVVKAKSSSGMKAPTWSPYGQWIAFTSTRDHHESYDVYVMAPDGSNETRLTSDPANDIVPRWWP